MRRASFSIIELIFVLLLVGIMVLVSTGKSNLSKVKLAKQQLHLHLQYLRYIAMLDNKYESDPNIKWYKKRWSLRFENCDSDVGGIFYSIYSDESLGGNINKEETLRDPLTNDHIFATSCKQDSLYDKSKFVLLTQYYGVQKVEVSCKGTRKIGLIGFGYDGKFYTGFEGDGEPYAEKVPCRITLYDGVGGEESLVIHPKTSYIEG